jgi:hypothetical protein
VLQDRLRMLTIKGKSLLPIVQGGIGVRVSAHRLAGNVARHGAVGTISSVDLRRHIERGLFFRGSEPLPFNNEIRPVGELIQYMLTGADPQWLFVSGFERFDLDQSFCGRDTAHFD